MQWARDADGESHILIRSAKSLLTVMTRVTVVWMDADRIAGRDSQTTSDVIAGIATATSIASVAGVVIEIAIGNTIDGVTGDRHS